jgi:hypothetical protein
MTEVPAGFGTPGPRRGDEMRTSGVNLAAWIVIVGLISCIDQRNAQLTEVPTLGILQLSSLITMKYHV